MPSYRPGALYDCWRPRDDVPVVDFPFKCGNAKCYKLFDPNIEHSERLTAGVVLLVLGLLALTGGSGCCCCGCSQCKKYQKEGAHSATQRASEHGGCAMAALPSASASPAMPTAVAQPMGAGPVAMGQPVAAAQPMAVAQAVPVPGAPVAVATYVGART